jgi:hypothetical protein
VISYTNLIEILGIPCNQLRLPLGCRLQMRQRGMRGTPERRGEIAVLWRASVKERKAMSATEKQYLFATIGTRAIQMVA